LACIWELRVISFERDAWVQSIRGSNGDRAQQIATYLEVRFDGDV